MEERLFTREIGKTCHSLPIATKALCFQVAFIVSAMAAGGCASNSSGRLPTENDPSLKPLLNRMMVKTVHIWGWNGYDVVYNRNLNSWKGQIFNLPPLGLPEQQSVTFNDRYLNGVKHGVVAKDGKFYLTDSKSKHLIFIGQYKIQAVSLSPNEDAFICLDQRGTLALFQHQRKIKTWPHKAADELFLNRNVFLLNHGKLYCLNSAGQNRVIASDVDQKLMSNNAQGLFAPLLDPKSETVFLQDVSSGWPKGDKISFATLSGNIDSQASYAPYVEQLCSTQDGHYIACKLKRCPRQRHKMSPCSGSLLIYDLRAKSLVYQSSFSTEMHFEQTRFNFLQVSNKNF